MSDETLTKLMAIVERAVRPVRATVSRKQHMREELLAHVTAIFEEEIETSSNERIALERTGQRFGDPQELSRELESSIPVLNRLRGHLEQIWCNSATFLLARRPSIQSGESGMSTSTASGPQGKSWKSVFVWILKPVRVEAICLGIGLGLCLVWAFVTYEITALLRTVS
jgi:hypothetical protein